MAEASLPTRELKKVGCIFYGDPSKYNWPPPIHGMDSNKHEELFAVGVSKRIKVSYSHAQLLLFSVCTYVCVAIVP